MSVLFRSHDVFKIDLIKFHSQLDPDALRQLGVHWPADLLLADGSEITQLSRPLKLLQRRLFVQTVSALQQLPPQPVLLDQPFTEWAAASFIAEPILKQLSVLGIKTPSDLLFLTDSDMQKLCKGLKSVEVRRIKQAHSDVLNKAHTDFAVKGGSHQSLKEWAVVWQLSSRTIERLLEVGVEKPTDIGLLVESELAIVSEGLNPLEVTRLELVFKEQFSHGNKNQKDDSHSEL